MIEIIALEMPLVDDADVIFHTCTYIWTKSYKIYAAAAVFNVLQQTPMWVCRRS